MSVTVALQSMLQTAVAYALAHPDKLRSALSQNARFVRCRRGTRAPSTRLAEVFEGRTISIGSAAVSKGRVEPAAAYPVNATRRIAVDQDRDRRRPLRRLAAAVNVGSARFPGRTRHFYFSLARSAHERISLDERIASSDNQPATKRRSDGDAESLIDMERKRELVARKSAARCCLMSGSNRSRLWAT